MLTYDSLAFIQEAVMLWVVLALAAVLIRVNPGDLKLRAESAV
jgi:hypothetical protein